jgi:hypothetical protein
MKGISRELGEMRFTLKSDAKLVKHRLYQLNPFYKQKVKEKIDRMLEASIIELVAESEWISLIMVQDKKMGGIIICVDQCKLNDAFLHDPLIPSPFTDEVLENVGGHEAYSFTDGLSGYHQIKIVQEDRNKTTFVTE